MTDINNKKALIDIFGRWPSFHDAEIIRMVLEREGDGGPYLEAQIHVFEMTTEIDAKGYYVLKNPTLVTFRFTHIVLEYLKWFNQQNVLWDLEIININPEENDGCNFKVVMPSSYGCEASFDCKDIVIVNVKPYEKTA
jgi:hypothetical protein